MAVGGRKHFRLAGEGLGQGLAVEDVVAQFAQQGLDRRAARLGLEFLEGGVQRHAGFEQQRELFGERDAVGHLDALQPREERGLCAGPGRLAGGAVVAGVEFDGHGA